jgi:hypothetical protein
MGKDAGGHGSEARGRLGAVLLRGKPGAHTYMYHNAVHAKWLQTQYALAPNEIEHLRRRSMDNMAAHQSAVASATTGRALPDPVSIAVAPKAPVFGRRH